MRVLHDLVFLIPGFLGFSRIAGFYYFADRVSATLRGALELSLGGSVPVVPLRIAPTGSLEERQAELLTGIAAVLKRLSDLDRIDEVTRIHLVGHSTGGVDAALLARQRPLSGASWADWEGTVVPAGFRRKLRALVAISAPFQGSSLSLTEMAAAYATPGDPHLWAVALSVLGKALEMYLRELPKQVTVNGFLGAALLSPGQTQAFLREVLFHRGLVTDLRPERMSALWHQNPADEALAVVQRSFVSVGARPCQASDPLYAHLHQQIAAQAALHTDAVARAGLLLLRRCPHLLRSQWTAAQRPVEAGQLEITDNDGVVDGARQLLSPQDPRELAGVVLGDHADVIGRYDNIDRLVDDQPLRAGAFHSGSLFSDGVFFQLYREVAHIIRDAALAAAPEHTDHRYRPAGEDGEPPAG